MPLAITVNTIGTVTWTIALGESVQAAVTISNSGTPINLTGYEVKMYINFLSPLTLSTGNGGITLTNPTAGICQVNITDTASEAFIAGSYLYEFWTISGGGQSTRLFYGQFVVLDSITPIP